MLLTLLLPAAVHCVQGNTNDLRDASFLYAARIHLPAGDYNLKQLKVGLSFPPVQNTTEVGLTIAHYQDLNANMIRLAENWSNREPTPGNYNWTPLDTRIDSLGSGGIPFVLTIQSTGPHWACNPAKQNVNSCVFLDNSVFQAWVELLLQRYASRLTHVQFGNEWTTEFHYAGTAAEFIAASNIVAAAVQTHAPHAKFVLGGLTSFSMRALAACEGRISPPLSFDAVRITTAAELTAFCASSEYTTALARFTTVLAGATHDMVDAHFYDDPENWPGMLSALRNRIGATPVIVTEFGGPDVFFETYSDVFLAERLYQYIRALDDLGIENALFFRLVAGADALHRDSGLLNANLTRRSAWYVFREFTRTK